MIDPFVLLAPILLLGVVALLGFVGCAWAFSIHWFPPDSIHLNTVAGYDAKVTLSWNAIPEATSYNISRTGGQGPTTFQSNAPAYVDQTVTTGTAYVYHIDALKDSDIIAQSRDSAPLIPGPISFQQLSETPETVVTDSIETPPFANVSPQSLVVVWIYYNSATNFVSTVQDSSGDAYMLVAPPQTGTAGFSDYRQEIWYKNRVTGGPGLKVTATFAAPLNAAAAISAHVYFNVDPTATAEISTSASGTGSVASSGMAQADSAKLIFGAAIFRGGGGTAGPGFNQRSVNQNNNASEDRNFDAPGQAEATFATTPPGTTLDWIAQMVAFK